MLLLGWLADRSVCRARARRHTHTHTHTAPGDNKATGVTGRQACLSTACAPPAVGWGRVVGPRDGGNVNTGKSV